MCLFQGDIVLRIGGGGGGVGQGKLSSVYCVGGILSESTDHLDDILVRYVIDSCVDNNITKSIEKVLLVKVWLNQKYEFKLVQTFKLKLSVGQMSPHVLVGQMGVGQKLGGWPSVPDSFTLSVTTFTLFHLANTILNVCFNIKFPIEWHYTNYNGTILYNNVTMGLAGTILWHLVC